MAMLNYVDPDEVVVDGRIRKDCGNLDELADDIRENGLINPPTVYYDLEDEKYHLIAGERRLRACKKISSMRKIPVLVITDPIDEEQRLRMEISENEVRQDFSKSERVDYMKRLARIEAIKAAERKKAGTKAIGGCSDEDPDEGDGDHVPNLAHGQTGRTRDIVAEQFGISHGTMQKEIEIVDHKADIDPEDFAAWDDGKLSTNKVYQDLKAKLAETTDKLDDTNHMLELYIQRAMGEAEKADKARKRLSEVETENIALKNREPEVVTKEVVPADYEELKDKLEETARSEQIMAAERQRYLEELRDARRRIEEMENRGEIEAARTQIQRKAEYLVSYAEDVVRQLDSYTWITSRCDELDEDTRGDLLAAILGISQLAEAMLKDFGKENEDEQG